MRKFNLFILLSACCFGIVKAGNPLTGRFRTPYETVPFNKIKIEHFVPAFEESIEELNEEIKAIAENPEPPTFENTIVALERSGKTLSQVNGAFFGILDADNSDEKMNIAQEVSPRITESQHSIYLNDTLFSRVKTIYDNRRALNLLTEDERLLEKTYDRFCDNGANLSPKDKERYRECSKDLNLLEIQFNQNALKDANRFELLITDEKDLSGLPEMAIETAAKDAKDKGKKGWLFTLSEPSYDPFIQYSDNREMREKMYRAKMNVGNNNNEFDNKEIVKKIVNLRLEIAQLMGYDNYAAYVLKSKMAKNEENVMQLLQQLLNNYKPLANTEYNILQGYIMGHENLTEIELMPWDWNYYSNKLKNLNFKLNDEMTRPYFELEHVTQCVFGLATDLFGLTFKENPKIQVYDEEVKAYEVYDKDENFVAVLYTDFYPRPTKASGAWMNNIQQQYVDEKDKDHRPQIVIAMNFGRPTPTKPSLLTYYEVETLMHEFGHALHGMLSQCKYASMSGTNVEQDFSELPSQIMENWMKNEEFLDTIAIHYQTKEKIPSDLVKKIVNSTNFHVGYDCCRQVSFGLLDMAWHTITRPFNGNIETFEKQAWTDADVLPEVPNTLISTSMDHLFANDEYAAGYYGYKWAEVLDADAFAAFQDAGIFSKAVAEDLRTYILSRGDSDDPNKLYIRFRCQQPTIDALLQRNGLMTTRRKR